MAKMRPMIAAGAFGLSAALVAALSGPINEPRLDVSAYPRVVAVGQGVSYIAQRGGTWYTGTLELNIPNNVRISRVDISPPAECYVQLQPALQRVVCPAAGSNVALRVNGTMRPAPPVLVITGVSSDDTHEGVTTAPQNVTGSQYTYLPLVVAAQE